MLTTAVLAMVLGLSPAPEPRAAPTAQTCADEGPAYAAATGGARLAYRDLGPADGRPVLLVAGTDQQMTQWPASVLADLQARGLRPIVYDARDVGCSTHHTESGAVDWGGVFAALGSGGRPALPYDLETLAADAAAVLDHLGVPRADVVGVSGGATVAGELAASAPERVGRLVMLMANSGNPVLPMPANPARLASLPPPPRADAEPRAVAAYRAAVWRAMDGTETLGSPDDYPAMARAATARSWDPDGVARTGAALLAAGDRRARLAGVRAPTTVIHGEMDPLISVAAGREVADAIPGATFFLTPGMGHGLTPRAVDRLLEGLTGDARQGGAQ